MHSLCLRLWGGDGRRMARAKVGRRLRDGDLAKASEPSTFVTKLTSPTRRTQDRELGCGGLARVIG